MQGSSSRREYRRALTPGSRPEASRRRCRRSPCSTPTGVAEIDVATAQSIARDVMTDLRIEAEALDAARPRSRRRRGVGRLARRRSGTDSPGSAGGPTTGIERMELRLLPGRRPGTADVVACSRAASFPRRTVELALEGGRYRIVRSEGGALLVSAPTPAAGARSAARH